MNEKLLGFVKAIDHLVSQPGLDESEILRQASGHMAALIAQDDWLPAEMALSNPEFYQQHLLYGDPQDRFSLVSFVWGPGQATPVHDHTVWGVIGMLRGAEQAIPYTRQADGQLLPSGAAQILRPGDVACVSPTIGDIHKVGNAVENEASISIHLYGGNIGRIERSAFDAQTGSPKSFVSGYSNQLVPNLWA